MLVDKVEEFFLKIFDKIGMKKFTKWYREHQEGMRYLVFGGLSTFVNIFTYAIFASLILKNIGSDTLRVNISDIVAFIVALIFAYVTNKLYVFKSKTSNRKELIIEMFSFLSCRIVTQIISLVLMNIAVIVNINDIIMKVIANIVVIILNFVFSKLLIFTKKEK